MSYIFCKDDVLQFADFLHASTHIKGNELFFTYCPYCSGGDHKDKDTCSVNLDNGTFNCFRSSCGRQGHFVEMARDFEYKLFNEGERQYRKLPQKAIEVKSAAVKYLEKRGISEEIARKYFITTQKHNDNVLVFPFYDENAELVFVKYRNTKFAGTGNKEWCEKDTKPILFGMAQCKDFERLIITEGQLDSLSVSECGFDNAVSVPTGARGFTWFANCYKWISKFSEVIVFGDWENGKMSLVDELAKRLKCKVKAVRGQDYLGEKDANDILTRYGRDAIVCAINNAEVPKINNVKDLSTVKTVDINTIPKIKTNMPELDRIIGGLAMGQVILLTGERGNGKSTFMSQIVAEALEQDESVFVYSGELADYHFKRWLDYQLAGPEHLDESVNAYGDKVYTLKDCVVEKISRWYTGRAYIYDNSVVDNNDAGELESLTQTVEKVICQYGVNLICIDNLMTAMEVTVDADLYRAQSKFVGELKKLAVRYDIAVILVAHPRKRQNGEFANDDVMGSGDITNKVDVILNYRRIDEANTSTNSRLEVTKNRLFGRLAKGQNAIDLFFNSATKRIASKSSGKRVYGWVKKSMADDETLPFELE